MQMQGEVNCPTQLLDPACMRGNPYPPVLGNAFNSGRTSPVGDNWGLQKTDGLQRGAGIGRGGVLLARNAGKKVIRFISAQKRKRDPVGAFQIPGTMFPVGSRGAECRLAVRRKNSRFQGENRFARENARREQRQQKEKQRLSNLRWTAKSHDSVYQIK